MGIKPLHHLCCSSYRKSVVAALLKEFNQALISNTELHWGPALDTFSEKLANTPLGLC
jgi:hypothetical protein